MDFDPDGPAEFDGIFGLPHTEDEAHVVVLPVPYAATASYGGGAERGPDAMLRASRQVDLFDIETGCPYKEGIFMAAPDPRIVELHAFARPLAEQVMAGASDGDEARRMRDGVNRASEEVDAIVYAQARDLLRKDKLVGVVGGDHSVSLGAILAHAEHFSEIGVLHIDAHADLRDAYMGFSRSHASVMHNVVVRAPGVSRLAQVAIRDLGAREHEAIVKSDGRIRTVFDAELARARALGRLFGLFDAIVESLPERVYVSVDIDGLDPSLCPHTGTPVPGGLSFFELSLLLGRVVEGGRQIVGFDLTEVSPGSELEAHGARDSWDAVVGARVLYKLIGWAQKAPTAPTSR